MCGSLQYKFNQFSSERKGESERERENKKKGGGAGQVGVCQVHTRSDFFLQFGFRLPSHCQRYRVAFI